MLTDEQIVKRRREWSYEINDEMLSDAQIMALPRHYEPHTHEEELADYANALLSRQRDRKRLRAALYDRRRWRGKSILLRKHWFRLGDKLTKLKAERDALAGRLEAAGEVLRETRIHYNRMPGCTGTNQNLERLSAALRGEGE